MRVRLLAAIALIVLAGGGFPGAQAQSAISVPKQFPWDQRPPRCFLPGMIHVQGISCVAPVNWPNYGETKRRVDRLILDPDFNLLERAEAELGFSRDKFPSGQYYFEAWFRICHSCTQCVMGMKILLTLQGNGTITRIIWCT